ncbi:Kinesin light chain 3 [Blyttiomyces sp. JEL0837]|nr:Kinesin light chain 3 [Blyttiomyces sp. JEL0837]
MIGENNFDIHLLPPLATIGLPGEQEDGNNGEDLWVITSNKESVAIPTWGIISDTFLNSSIFLVKPLTTDHQGSVCDVLIEQGRYDAVQPANWFVSHAWEYDFMDMIDALASFFDDRDTDPNKPWDDPISLKRAWCILEVLGCERGNGSFHALSPKENQRMLRDLLDEFSYDGMLSRVNSEKSNATNPDDRDLIFEAIEYLTSFSALDRLVLKTYNAALISCAEQHVEKALRESKSPLNVVDSQLVLIKLKISLF